MPTLIANFVHVLRRSGLVALLIAATAGCWEEIKYEPGPEPVRPRREAEPAPPTEPTSPPAETAADPPAETAPPATTPTSESPLAEPPLDLTEQPPSAEPVPGDAQASSFPEEAAEPASSELPVAPAEAAPPEATAAQRLLIWQAAGKWSFAAAMSAKRLPAEQYEPKLAEAEAAASELGLKLPPLPQAAGDQTLETAVVDALSGIPATAFAAVVADRYGKPAAALGELAVRSNLLLLTYSPRRSDLAEQARQFTAMAEASGLPRDAWAPLAKLLEEKGEYVEVRAAVFAFHQQAEKALAEPTP